MKKKIVVKEKQESHLSKIAKDFDLWIPGEDGYRPKFYFSTTSTLLDLAIGEEGKGIPSGCMVEVAGWESTGKTAIGAAIGGSCQKQGGVVVLYDVEATFDYNQNKLYGLDPTKVLSPPSSPGTIEELFEHMRGFLKKTDEKCYCILTDSIAALETLEEADKSFTDATMGTQRARKFSQVLRAMTNLIKEKQATLVFINQLREDIGKSWGRRDISPGGRAIRFYSSVRIVLKHEGKIKADKNVIGIDIEAEVIKNKVGIPYRKAKFPLYFNYGIDDSESCVNFIRENSDRLGAKGGKYIYEHAFRVIEEKSLVKFLNLLENEGKVKYIKEMVKEVWDRIYSDNRGRIK